jgi:hypothetical protein
MLLMLVFACALARSSVSLSAITIPTRIKIKGVYRIGMFLMCGRHLTLYGKLTRENMMSSSVAAFVDLRFAANAIPTWENSRMDDAGGVGRTVSCC